MTTSITTESSSKSNMGAFSYEVSSAENCCLGERIGIWSCVYSCSLNMVFRLRFLGAEESHNGSSLCHQDEKCNG